LESSVPQWAKVLSSSLAIDWSDIESVKGQQELLVGGQGFSIPADSSSPSGRTGLLHFRRLMMAFICYLTALTRS